MGQSPKATVIYTASGHVATIFTATGRTAPAGSNERLKGPRTDNRMNANGHLDLRSVTARMLLRIVRE
jgi:hypothetical protein